MKKLLTLTLVLSLLLCGCGKEESTETLSREDLIYGPAVEEPAPSDLVTIPEEQEAVTLPQGETTTLRVLKRMSVLNDDGVESWYREYEYDAQGRLAKEIEAGSGGESYRAEYVYEENRVTVTYSSSGNVTEVVTRILDEAGRLASSKAALPGETPYMVMEYTYDDQGNMLSCSMELEGESSIQSFTYTYRQDGKVIGEKEMLDGELVAQREYFYDDQDRLTESLSIDAAGLCYTTVHSWEGSTETVTTLDDQDNVTIVTVHTYDDQGNLLRDETQQEGTVISCAEYTYEDMEIPKN